MEQPASSSPWPSTPSSVASPCRGRGRAAAGRDMDGRRKHRNRDGDGGRGAAGPPLLGTRDSWRQGWSDRDEDERQGRWRLARTSGRDRDERQPVGSLCVAAPPPARLSSRIQREWGGDYAMRACVRAMLTLVVQVRWAGSLGIGIAGRQDCQLGHLG